MIVQQDRKIDGLFVREAVPHARRFSTPLVMIPGGSHGWWAYQEWLPVFAERGWTGYALSLRNHTDSYAIPDEDYIHLALQDYVADVLRVLEWIGTRVTLMGHSMGGIIAQKIAELVNLSALILISPVGPGQLGSINTQVPADRPVMLDAATVRRLWFHAVTDDRFAEIYHRLCPESPWVVNEYRSGKVLIDRSKIHCPILVIEGEYDRSGVHDSQAVAKFYDATYVQVRNAGHDLMLEPGAAEVAETIAQWLLKVP